MASAMSARPARRQPPRARRTGSRARTRAQTRAEARTPAWAGDPPTLHAAARERLLEAAVRCVARDGMAGANVAAVAAEAGVSRPTVYRYFADREALVEATMMHAGRDLAERLGAELRRAGTPAEMAVDAMCFVLQEIPREPVLGAIWKDALLDANTVASITRRPALAFGREALASLVRAAGWSDAAADEAIELMLRLLLSLLAAPEPRRSDAALRAFLLRRLVPALGLATPGRSPTR
jgi:AcrR family transcriptional regulator